MNERAKKSVIVTGGNTGLGYQCAKRLASSGAHWHVVIASRDMEKAMRAVEGLRSETGHEQIEAMRLDLGSLTSVRGFARDFADRNLPPLHAIVCNAGLGAQQSITYTEDGFETLFGVNHLGHFLLVNLLLRSLVAPARIVFVSSGTHDPDTLDGRFNPPLYRDAKSLAWPEKTGARPLSGIRRYSSSKLCNLFCAYELSRRLRAEGLSTLERPITVNAYDPGATPSTQLIREQPSFVQQLWTSPILHAIVRLLGTDISTVKASGNAMARLVLDPALEGITGKYFHILKETYSSKESYDQEKAAELWEASAEFVKLMPDETLLRVRGFVV